MYKKFVIKTIIVLLILLLTYSEISLNYKMLYMEPEYPMWKEVKDRINKKSNVSVNLVMLGDSRAKAGFKPTLLNNINAINLSLGGATPVEGYFTINNYLKNNPKPDKVVLSYTPTHLESDNAWLVRTVPFDFLSNKEYEEVEKMEYQLNKVYINKSYTYYKNPFVYGNYFINGLKEKRWIKNKIFYNECKKFKGYHWFGRGNISNGFNDETRRKTKFNYSKLHNYYLEKILKLLTEKQIEIYYYTMPFNKSSFDVIKKEYINGYISYINSLSKKYNIKICNIPFYMSNDNFGDPSHLFKGVNKNTYKIYDCTYKKRETINLNKKAGT